MNKKKAGTIILYADVTGQTQVRFCLCHSKWVAIRSQLKNYITANSHALRNSLFSYGISDFKQVWRESKYLVDKTMYFERMEREEIVER